MAVVSQLPGKLDLHVVRGDDAAVQLTFKDDAAAVIDMSGRTLTSKLLLATGTDLSGGALTLDTTDAATGVVVVPLPDTLTTSLTGEVYRWVLRDDSNDRVLLDGFVRVYAPGSAGASSGLTSVTVTVTNSMAAVTVTAAVVGAAGADGSDGLDQAAVDARIAAASIDGAQIQSGTVPDAHIPAAIARDSEVTAAIAAAGKIHAYLVTPAGNVPLTGISGVFGENTPADGTPLLLENQTTTSENGGYTYDAGTDALVADGFKADAAHLGHVVSVLNPGGTATLRIVGIGESGPELQAFPSAEITTDDVTVTGQSGLYSGYNDQPLGSFLQGAEGRDDDKRYVTSIVTPDQITASGAGDLATLTGGAVADEDQPLDHRGIAVAKGTNVGILSTGPSSVGGAWYAEVDATTGQWTVRNYPVQAYLDGASTNAVVGGAILLALDGTRAEYVPLIDGAPSMKQSQLNTNETVDGVWAVTPGTEYVAP